MIEQGYKGEQDPNSGAGMFNAVSFIAEQILSKVNVATLVEVVSVTNAGTLAPVGFVDVKPLINQVDGFGNAIEHVTVFKVPYMRLQGGANAVIIDPQVGDIGIAVFADRDISTVKITKTKANPNSARRFSKADGLYLGGVLNGTPTQYVIFGTSGVKIVSPTAIEFDAPSIKLNGVEFTTHTHTVAGVQAGGSTLPTSVPVPI